MARYTHANGVTVEVRDDKVLPNDWKRIEGGTGEPTEAEGYSSLKVEELKADIARRNEGRAEADLLSVEGKKADLIAALEADDNK